MFCDEISATGTYFSLFPQNIAKRGKIDEIFSHSMSVTGEIRTVYYSNSYLVPTNAETLLQSDDRLIVTAFLVASAQFEHTTALHCTVLCSPVPLFVTK
jgi:hypothetical protein